MEATCLQQLMETSFISTLSPLLRIFSIWRPTMERWVRSAESIYCIPVSSCNHVWCPSVLQIRSIEWSHDDSRLVSCGMDGAVYEWNTHTGKRQSESILKSCSYTGVAFSSCYKTILAVGTDSTLKEIQDSQVWSHNMQYNEKSTIKYLFYVSIMLGMRGNILT